MIPRFFSPFPVVMVSTMIGITCNINVGRQHQFFSFVVSTLSPFPFDLPPPMADILVMNTTHSLPQPPSPSKAPKKKELDNPACALATSTIDECAFPTAALMLTYAARTIFLPVRMLAKTAFPLFPSCVPGAGKRWWWLW